MTKEMVEAICDRLNRIATRHPKIMYELVCTRTPVSDEYGNDQETACSNRENRSPGAWSQSMLGFLNTAIGAATGNYIIAVRGNREQVLFTVVPTKEFIR